MAINKEKIYILVAGIIVGYFACLLITISNNRICFRNGECHTFYTADQMKAWLYEQR